MGVVIALDVLVYNVPEELGQLSQTGLHGLVVAFGHVGAAPPEVAHLVGPVPAPLLVQLGRPGAAPSSRLPLLVPVAAPLPASLARERRLDGVAPLLGRGQDLDGPAFTPRRLPPTEVLHGVGAPLVVVGRQVCALVFGGHDGQQDAKQVFLLVHAFEFWALGVQQEPALNVVLFGENRRDSLSVSHSQPMTHARPSGARSCPQRV